MIPDSNPPELTRWLALGAALVTFGAVVLGIGGLVANRISGQPSSAAAETEILVKAGFVLVISFVCFEAFRRLSR